MKKILFVLLVIIVFAGFTGCSVKPDPVSSKTNQNAQIYVDNLQFVKAKNKNACFAVGTGIDDVSKSYVSITYVPCELVGLK